MNLQKVMIMPDLAQISGENMTNTKFKDEILLAQWQTCVEMANSVSQRRDTMNNIFITLNTAIMATFAILSGIKSIIILFAGIVVCCIWIMFIKYYRHLNTAKFEVINKIEKDLPIQAFNEEWVILKSNKNYLDGTKLETLFAKGLILFYLVMTIVSVYGLYLNINIS